MISPRFLRCFFKYVLTHSKLKKHFPKELKTITLMQLWKLCSENLDVSELADLQLMSYIVYLMPSPSTSCSQMRASLLQRSFSVVPTLEPSLVHYFTERLVKRLGTNNTPPSRGNLLLNLSHLLANTGGVGRAVSVCLLWSLIFNAANVNPIIHQYHDLSELFPLLYLVPVEDLGKINFEELLESVAALLHRQLCCSDLTEFHRYGYSSMYFRIQPMDVLRLRDWLIRSLKTAGIQRPGIAARRVQSALNYMDLHSASWCLVCRNQGGAFSGDCVLAGTNI